MKCLKSSNCASRPQWHSDGSRLGHKTHANLCGCFDAGRAATAANRVPGADRCRALCRGGRTRAFRALNPGVEIRARDRLGEDPGKIIYGELDAAQAPAPMLWSAQLGL